jgi:hypothetical protein
MVSKMGGDNNMSAKILQLHEFANKRREDRLCKEIQASVEYLTSGWASNEDIDLNAITVATDMLFSMYSDSDDDSVDEDIDLAWEESWERDINFDYKDY